MTLPNAYHCYTYRADRRLLVGGNWWPSSKQRVGYKGTPSGNARRQRHQTLRKMFIEQLKLTNFRSFGPESPIDLGPGLTAFIGANGAGKTVVMQALQRLFGVVGEQRHIRRQDFHVPVSESSPPLSRRFVLEAVLAFPELEGEAGQAHTPIPEFFHQMASDETGTLKCRLRLEATWTDDGSLDGLIEHKYWAIRTLGNFGDEDCVELKAVDRARIQMIYVPASRDGSSLVTAFLKGRLWRAINWSAEVREQFDNAGLTLNTAFSGEAAVDVVAAAVTRRWREVHTAGTDTTPIFRPIDLRFQEFIRKVDVVFHPDENGRERALDELSDGQRSLFHLAMTAATLDVENSIIQDPAAAGFQPGGIPLPALTLIAVEEPENNLAPFYLSRIVRQIEDLTGGTRAQAVVSSHSASILSRVDPVQVRHFRLDAAQRVSLVRAITLPQSGPEEESKFIREAVRAYPELYFARFVVLGEGASEEVVIPLVAEALGLDIDRSFVVVVPLGGRHVNHLWRLLSDLSIPYATLLDLDWGREGGGWGRIKNACAQLLEIGVAPEAIFSNPNPAGPAHNLAEMNQWRLEDTRGLDGWIACLQRHHVFFCKPLDLDYSMLRAFPVAYQVIEPGRLGPSNQGDPRTAVLGEHGRGDLYLPADDQLLRWYRYLFLGRGKPSTHVRVLSGLSHQIIGSQVPPELRVLLTDITDRLEQGI